MLERVTRKVFQCFHGFEAFFDRLTGRVGPFFVLLCTLLLGLGVVTFYDVYYPRIFLSLEASWLTSIIGTLWSLYVVASFAFHYYSAVTILPGSPQDAPGSTHQRPFFTWSSTPTSTKAKGAAPPSSEDSANARRAARALAVQTEPDESVRKCKKCPLVRQGDDWEKPPKPERTHHCSICKTCWLKYDHHCPWINGCVGLHNERYFLLFMVHLALGCISVTFLGFDTLLSTLDFRSPWPHYAPRPFAMLLWILSIAMAFALAVMAVWQSLISFVHQLWLVAKGETTVEANDNAYYRKLAIHKKRTYLNPYDLGKRQNLANFFNVGRGRYPVWTILLPIRIPPSTDGWTWIKRKDWQAARVEEWEELTDEEEGGE